MWGAVWGSGLAGPIGQVRQRAAHAVALGGGGGLLHHWIAFPRPANLDARILRSKPRDGCGRRSHSPAGARARPGGRLAARSKFRTQPYSLQRRARHCAVATAAAAAAAAAAGAAAWLPPLLTLMLWHDTSLQLHTRAGRQQNTYRKLKERINIMHACSECHRHGDEPCRQVALAAATAGMLRARGWPVHGGSGAWIVGGCCLNSFVTCR